MPRKYEKPTEERTVGPGNSDEIRLTHPAYGMVLLSRWQGGNTRFFGSDLTHGCGMTITILPGETRRDLYHDWHHQRSSAPLLSFDLTEAQWSPFRLVPEHRRRDSVYHQGLPRREVAAGPGHRGRRENEAGNPRPRVRA